jgi:hypothetical protein
MNSISALMRAIADNPYVNQDTRDRARHLLFVHHKGAWWERFL